MVQFFSLLTKKLSKGGISGFSYASDGRYNRFTSFFFIFYRFFIFVVQLLFSCVIYSWYRVYQYIFKVILLLIQKYDFTVKNSMLSYFFFIISRFFKYTLFYRRWFNIRHYGNSITEINFLKYFQKILIFYLEGIVKGSLVILLWFLFFLSFLYLFIFFFKDINVEEFHVNFSEFDFVLEKENSRYTEGSNGLFNPVLLNFEYMTNIQNSSYSFFYCNNFFVTVKNAVKSSFFGYEFLINILLIVFYLMLVHILYFTYLFVSDYYYGKMFRFILSISIGLFIIFILI